MRKLSNKKAAPKLVSIIKNGHTDAELDEMAERWINHQGPYLTLAKMIALEKAKQQNQKGNEKISSD